MKRITLAAVLLIWTFAVAAQVEKHVEVTKNYVPRLEKAQKLPMEAMQLDTARIHPDIDYTITPRTFTSALSMKPFRPATVTYWDFAHCKPFLLSAGLGYPLRSEVDMYVATERAGRGYVSGYLNHTGYWSTVKSEDMVCAENFHRNSIKTQNRVGAFAGAYLGRYTLDGSLHADMDIYHRFPSRQASNKPLEYDDIVFDIRLADQFADLSHTNFSISANAAYMADRSDHIIQQVNMREARLGAKFELARNVSRAGRIDASLGYEGIIGLRDNNAYRDHMVCVDFQFSRSRTLLSWNLGVRYCLDFQTLGTRTTRHRILPQAGVMLDLTRKGFFVPYARLESEVRHNSYLGMAQDNPYLALIPYTFMPLPFMEKYGDVTMDRMPATTTRTIRAGISGRLFRERFAYDLHAGFQKQSNTLYWYSMNGAYMAAIPAKSREWFISARVEYRPLSRLKLSARYTRHFHDKFLDIPLPRPNYEADFAVRYTARRFSIGATAQLQGRVHWYSVLWNVEPGGVDYAEGTDRTPAVVNVGLQADWKLSDFCTLFLRGENLANSKIYYWNRYREYGIGFLAGVRLSF